MSTPDEVLGALADGARLRLFARIVLAGEEGVSPADLEGEQEGAARLVPRLLRAGLVTRRGSGRLVAHPEVFRHVAEQTRSSTAAAPEGTDRAVAALFSRGRLVAIPTQPRLRTALLVHLTEQLFAPEVRYSEKEVSRALARYYDDFATLRRCLVDEGELARSADGQQYWRPAVNLQ